jgi:hypothetical protein
MATNNKSRQKTLNKHLKAALEAAVLALHSNDFGDDDTHSDMKLSMALVTPDGVRTEVEMCNCLGSDGIRKLRPCNQCKNKSS